ncbi:MAG: hypothetical protein IT536_16245 [Hyphomicrobiales bacterium]|nr:hypothetical protein [Hyphomicrobiales bacterium]
MRTIQISTDVFAALWASRRGDEQTEDEILRSLLKVKPVEPPATPPATRTKIGYADPRNGLQFPEGFEVFRNYHGTRYSAKAHNGAWVREDTGEAYPSLNALNRSIGARFQNAWRGWYCMKDGRRTLLHDLRKADSIARRS